LTDGWALALLQDAVSIPSPSGREQEVAALLAARMAGFTDSAFVDEAGNAVGVMGDGPLQLTCLGHLDTVPGSIPVRIEAGELWGRGSVDAKGAFCTAVAGVARAFRHEPQLRRRLSVRLIGAVGEEAPGSPGARFALKAYPAPDFLLISEPSGWDSVTLGYKGRLVAKLEVRRSEFHSAGQGSTAAETLVCAWLKIREFAAQYGAVTKASGAFESLQASLTGFSTVTDGLQQTARATVSLRLPPGLTVVEARLAVERIAARVTTDLQQEPGAGSAAACRVRFSGGEDAVRSERDSQLSRAWRVAIREQGGRPRFKLKTGTSDLNVVAPRWAAPALAYGPGDSRLDHAPDERLPLEEYLKAVVITSRAVHLLGARPRDPA
jgi:LysW-gamma-L-lysine carboxypeptidase